jgi:hypothetical protein
MRIIYWFLICNLIFPNIIVGFEAIELWAGLQMPAFLLMSVINGQLWLSLGLVFRAMADSWI